MENKLDNLYDELIQRRPNPFEFGGRNKILAEFVNKYGGADEDKLDAIVVELITMVEKIERHAFKVGYLEGRKAHWGGGDSNA